ncbi:hypothetical protein Ppa06_07350 [Planomonospora parontospora subsp. parontospora]|uniref:DUF3558 domain-containing protein n=2 Tax=Planomonospora parontospora TaxID=58119 RepID=A0AA37BDC7_9ACTN|nr:hypothetical protein [Planomonospora parontospora]GGK51933.1 hypothetical protein GCM10010126_09260 [Planomonospora parontospora]GII06937.1 hypothetical protein Ppa06_07350 [Planomonospora parontospora subsp. parontospora]
MPGPDPALRRRWAAPVAAGAAALAVTGGVLVHLAAGSGVPEGPAGDPAASSSQPPVRPADGDPDVCAMVGGAELARLVPQAAVKRGERDDALSTVWNCSWNDSVHPAGDHTEQATIRVQVMRYKEQYGLTAEERARAGYALHLRIARTGATAPAGDHRISSVTPLTGVGDEAHVRHTRSTASLATGDGFGRVGDVLVTVEYRAVRWPGRGPRPFGGGQDRPVPVEDALRETELVLRQVSAAVATWRRGRP